MMTINEKFAITWLVIFILIGMYGYLEIVTLSINIRWILFASWISLGAIVEIVGLWKTK
jgi:hypothetical protein